MEFQIDARVCNGSVSWELVETPVARLTPLVPETHEWADDLRDQQTVIAKRAA